MAMLIRHKPTLPCVCVCACVLAYVRACMRACLHMCVLAYVLSCVTACVLSCVTACVCVCACMDRMCEQGGQTYGWTIHNRPHPWHWITVWPWTTNGTGLSSGFKGHTSVTTVERECVKKLSTTPLNSPSQIWQRPCIETHATTCEYNAEYFQSINSTTLLRDIKSIPSKINIRL